MAIPMPSMPPLATDGVSSPPPDAIIPATDESRAAAAAEVEARIAAQSVEQQTIAAAPVAQQIPAAPAQQTIPAAPAQQTIPAAPAQQTIPAAPVAQQIPAAPAQQTIPAAPVAQQIPAAPAQQMEPAAQPPAAQPLAVAQETPLAEQSQQPMSMAAIAEQMGFGGLNFDAFGIVPNISLNNGEWRLTSGEVLPDGFLCRLGTNRNKILYVFDLPDTDQRKKTLYSYDRVNSINNNYTVAQFRRDAEQLGCRVLEKTYHEVSAVLEDGRPVNLSIPELGSGTALAGFFVKCVSRGLTPQSVMTRVKKGTLVTTSIKPYTPWAFEIVEPPQ